MPSFPNPAIDKRLKFRSGRKCFWGCGDCCKGIIDYRNVLVNRSLCKLRTVELMRIETNLTLENRRGNITVPARKCILVRASLICSISNRQTVLIKISTAELINFTPFYVLLHLSFCTLD